MGEIKTKKVGIFRRMINSMKATKSEFKKVVWPTKKQLINNTAIVIAALVVVGLIIFGLDTAFVSLAELVIGK